MPTGSQPQNLFETVFPGYAGKQSVPGTWGPTTGVLGYLNPFSRDYGYTEAAKQATGGQVSAEATTKYNNPALVQKAIGSTGPSADAGKLVPGTNLFVGDIVNGQRWNGVNWETQNAPSSGGGGGGGNGGNPYAGYNVGDIVGNQRVVDPAKGITENAFGGYNSLVDMQNAQVDSAFNSGMDVLNQQANDLQSQQPAQEQYITDQYGNLVSKAQTEGQQLTGDTQTKQSDFNTTVQNALQDATRAYQALKQQIMSRFGFGSSAGQGANDIASQEYYRTMGNNQQEGIRGTGEFAKEFGKIKTYVSQKVSDLDLWKSDTLNKLKSDLSDKLNQIATAKSTLIGNKAYATMQVMQNAVANAQAIAQSDKQYRQQIASDALNNMQQVAGRAFSPAEIKATLASFGIDVPGGQVAASNPTNMYKIAGRNQDELNQTNPLGG